MQMQRKLISRRLLVVCAALLLALGGIQSFAQNNSSTGALSVSATVVSSIQLTFSTATSGVGLTGTGTNSATLAFGSIALYGSNQSGVSINPSPNSGFCSSCFSASTPISIVVNEADSGSSSFTLTAYGTVTGSEKLAVSTSSSPTAPLSTVSGTPTQISNSLVYGSGGNTAYVAIGIPSTTASSTVYTDSINFIATAN